MNGKRRKVRTMRLQIENCKLRIVNLRFSICNFQFAISNLTLFGRGMAVAITSVVVFGLALLVTLPVPPAHSAEELLPKHVTPDTLKAVRTGLDYLARTQGADGGWHESAGGEAYPVAVTSLAGIAFLANGNTPTRGRYAPQVQAAVDYLLKCSEPSGIITGPNNEMGRPMHGHGFALLFLASVYGTETKEATRVRLKEVVDKAVNLTARGQSGAGGWTYIPGAGDEGSVTVMQVQVLRAANNAGFNVPRATIEESVRYIERCSTPEGGICYSLGSGGGPRLA